MSEAALQPFIRHQDLPSEVVPVFLDLINSADWDRYAKSLSDAQRVFAGERKFTAKAGQRVRLPEADGRVKRVLLGLGENDPMSEMRVGSLGESLPPGFYRFGHVPSDFDLRLAAIGWGLGSYKFDRYLMDKSEPPTLVLDDEASETEIISSVAATALCRDLINTPASDMGPAALEQAARDLAKSFGAEVTSVVGEDLLEQNFPMIHAVGRAAHEAPRLVEIEWGDASYPRLAIIGKGITFDTGGVNMKLSLIHI